MNKIEMKRKSKLLFNRPPRVYDEILAVLVGDREAQILQQVHYWVEINREARRNFRDGHYWTYCTYEGWKAKFPWLHLKKIKKYILRLEGMGLIISGNYNDLKIDRTKWYRIDYDKLAELENAEENAQSNYLGNGESNQGFPMAQNGPIGETETDTPIESPYWDSIRAQYAAHKNGNRKGT